MKHLSACFMPVLEHLLGMQRSMFSSWPILFGLEKVPVQNCEEAQPVNVVNIELDWPTNIKYIPYLLLGALVIFADPCIFQCLQL